MGILITSKRYILFALAAVLCVSGCAYHVATPPTNTLFAANPRILDTNQSEVRGGIGGVGELFGPGYSFGNFAYSFSWDSTTTVQMLPVMQQFADTVGKLYAKGGQLNVITRPSGWSKNTSLLSGVGVAFSKYGNYVSVHSGIVLGYENRYLVPSLTSDFYYSSPWATMPIVWDEWGTDYKHITSTFGVSFTPSLSLRLGTPIEIRTGIPFGLVFSRTDSFSFFGIDLSAAVVF